MGININYINMRLHVYLQVSKETPNTIISSKIKQDITTSYYTLNIKIVYQLNCTNLNKKYFLLQNYPKATILINVRVLKVK